MSTFPYDGKSRFTLSADPSVSELQKAHSRVEEMLLATGRVDPDVKLIAHLDRSPTGHRGQVGTITGPVRYWTGRFPNSQGLLIEAAGRNLVPNPSAEVNTTGFTALDAAISLGRSTGVSFQDNGVISAASFRMAGTGDAGSGGITSGSLAISGDTSYAASVYVFSEKPAKAMLEVSFTGGAAVAYDTGEMTLAGGEWTRLELENLESGDNTAAEVRLYLVPEAPKFAPDSLLSRREPGDTALATDTLDLAEGDVVLCAVSAHPSGPKDYSWHMVTAGTAVLPTDLRLDDADAYPAFAPGSRISKFAEVMSNATVDDTGLVLAAGDLVFCRLRGEGYAWHLVTTGATGVSSTALRLDGAPAAPEFEDGSLLSMFGTDDVLVGGSMTIDSGDLLFCFPTEEPATTGYAWHVATTGASVGGPSDPSLRLDGSQSPPTFAAGSRVARMAPQGTDLVSNVSMALAAGDLVFCHPTENPSEARYGWHMVTTAATGVSSPALRLDQSTSGVLHADAFQLEEGRVSGFIDSYQGSGFTGSLGGVVTRAAGRLSYGTEGVISRAAGTVAFWAYPLWPADDDEEHVLFDMAISSSRDRIRFSKSVDNKLVLSVYDGDSELKQIVSNDTLEFDPRTWQHFAFTWSGGDLAVYHDGGPLTTTTVGGGSGELSELPPVFHLGSDHQGNVKGSVVLDDLVIKGVAATETEIDVLALANAPYLGLMPVLSAFSAGGAGVTHATPGTEVAIPHGLGVLPGAVLLMPASNGVIYLSPEPDETNFYVKGSAASLDFYWRAFA